jgi:hypothetical protein
MQLIYTGYANSENFIARESPLNWIYVPIPTARTKYAIGTFPYFLLQKIGARYLESTDLISYYITPYTNHLLQQYRLVLLDHHLDCRSFVY